MVQEIKIYKDPRTGSRIVEIYDLSYIGNRNHEFGWFGLHFRHFRIKILLKWADKVYVPDYQVAVDLVKYYFYSRENIVVDRTILPADKA
jgi:hypothetical protein